LNAATDTFESILFNIKYTHHHIATTFSKGIRISDLQKLKKTYGACQLEVPRNSIPRLLVDEVLNPFYLFQVFSVCLWMWDGYQKYAYCILAISISGVLENLYETVSNINSVRKLAHYVCDVQVLR